MQCRYIEYKWAEPETCAHNYIVPVIIKIIRKLELPSDSKILDAGCGGGNIMNILHQDGFQNICGFDASVSGIKLAKENFPEIKDRFYVHNAYEQRLPDIMPAKNYDVVISVEVIEHLYSPRIYLEHINYWLKQKGYLIITTPYHGYLKNLLISILNKWDKHFNSDREGEHIKFFSKRTLYIVLEDSGFKPINFYGSGRLSFLWKSMIVVAQKI